MRVWQTRGCGPAAPQGTARRGSAPARDADRRLEGAYCLREACTTSGRAAVEMSSAAAVVAELHSKTRGWRSTSVTRAPARCRRAGACGIRWRHVTGTSLPRGTHPARPRRVRGLAAAPSLPRPLLPDPAAPPSPPRLQRCVVCLLAAPPSPPPAARRPSRRAPV